MEKLHITGFRFFVPRFLWLCQFTHTQSAYFALLLFTTTSSYLYPCPEALFCKRCKKRNKSLDSLILEYTFTVSLTKRHRLPLNIFLIIDVNTYYKSGFKLWRRTKEMNERICTLQIRGKRIIAHYSFIYANFCKSVSVRERAKRTKYKTLQICSLLNTTHVQSSYNTIYCSSLLFPYSLLSKKDCGHFIWHMITLYFLNSPRHFLTK